jgi:hypothetical protein
MNIFFLAKNPRVCAEWHCDQHCSKMIIEYAQLMSTAHRVTESPYADQVYKIAHKNHPSTIWTRASYDHYAWLYELWRELNNEFYKRRGKHHLSWSKLGHVLCFTPPALPAAGWVDPPQCMPDYLKGDECVEAYRRFYCQEKRKFATWNWGSPKPMWWDWDEYNEEDQTLMVISEGGQV